MINITKNTLNNFCLELNGLSDVACSGPFFFRFKHINTDAVVFFSTPDISESCRYNEFQLTDDQNATDMERNGDIYIDDAPLNMFNGQYDYAAYAWPDGGLPEVVDQEWLDGEGLEPISEGILIVDGFDTSTNQAYQ